MVVTLSDDEVSDNESSSDEEGNFVTFIATTVVDENFSVEENLSDGKLESSNSVKYTMNV